MTLKSYIYATLQSCMLTLSKQIRAWNLPRQTVRGDKQSGKDKLSFTELCPTGLFPISDRPYQNMCEPNLFYGFQKNQKQNYYYYFFFKEEETLV